MFFSVVLQSSNQQLILNPSSITIEINNDGGGMYIVCCMYNIMLFAILGKYNVQMIFMRLTRAFCTGCSAGR